MVFESKAPDASDVDSSELGKVLSRIVDRNIQTLVGVSTNDGDAEKRKDALLHSARYIHTYIHTYIYSYIHTLIHSYSHTYIISYNIHMLIHSYAHTYIFSYNIHMLIHTCRRIKECLQLTRRAPEFLPGRLIGLNIQTNIHACMHTYIHTLILFLNAYIYI